VSTIQNYFNKENNGADSSVNINAYIKIHNSISASFFFDKYIPRKDNISSIGMNRTTTYNIVSFEVTSIGSYTQKRHSPFMPQTRRRQNKVLLEDFEKRSCSPL
jgi:hypothetical protein